MNFVSGFRLELMYISLIISITGFSNERQAIAHACAHAHLEMSRQAKNCLPNKQQITHLDCFYFLQAQRKKEKHKKENIN